MFMRSPQARCVCSTGSQAGARNFVLGSTGGLYGTSEQPVSETGDLPDQRSPDSFRRQRAAELLAQQYAGQINVATLRFFFVYGAGQPAPMLLPRLASNVRDGNPIFLHGDDGLRLNPIHVDDAVNAIRQSLQLTESRVFNIAGPEVTTPRAIGGKSAIRSAAPGFQCGQDYQAQSSGGGHRAHVARARRAKEWRRSRSPNCSARRSERHLKTAFDLKSYGAVPCGAGRRLQVRLVRRHRQERADRSLAAS